MIVCEVAENVLRIGTQDSRVGGGGIESLKTDPVPGAAPRTLINHLGIPKRIMPSSEHRGITGVGLAGRISHLNVESEVFTYRQE
ncbi:hypothetical protein CEXT_726001 [Caerostris extrusa]|uniref:Uncharacterized protein n=1 Tax=Caerostris extrusa TaxID=172846 RepID=A0AAV4M6X8_CAEEX|nr:hypothetical protein CEXT_726001 [Caerostris extrusa]